jgi:hypothetical protein
LQRKSLLVALFEKCSDFRYWDAIGGEADIRPGQRDFAF